MTTSLETHEGCGGKLVLPKVYYKDQNNKTTYENTGNNYWCVRCKTIVKIEVKQN